MPFSRLFLCFLLPVFFAVRAFGVTHYVDLNCTNSTPPYTNWATAATNIQDAANYGGEIVVTNGVYRNGGAQYGAISNRVFAGFITLRSVNGPTVTIIEGYPVPGTTNGAAAVRCVALPYGGNLIGFTLTNGATGSINGPDGQGGGLYCEQATLVSNCVIVGNSAYYAGGGASLSIYGSSLTLSGCTIASNSCFGAGGGGGLYNGVASNCTFVGNWANNGGGSSGYSGTLNNCNLRGNFATQTGGATYGGTLINCLVVGNYAPIGGGIFESHITNCTIVSNSASYVGGWWGPPAGATGPVGLNSIIYYNTATNRPNYDSSATLAYCCTTPDVGSPFQVWYSITNAPPLFDGNFHLQSNSPCINAGRNSYVTLATDFDGNPRIVGGTVDIGAYEYQSPTSVLSYGWAQQYGLPTDGSADFADNDGDGMNNWQEWLAETDPTNAASVLKMFAPSNGAPGLNVSWSSVVGKYYYLLRSTNLSQGFSVIQSNIYSPTNVMVYQDTTATNRGQYFYRVGVQ